MVIKVRDQKRRYLKKRVFKFEYVTSAVSVMDGDGIVVVHVVNDSSVVESARVVIYKNTGAGAVTVSDLGSDIAPTWNWGLGYAISESGEYWLRIQASSEFLLLKPRLNVFGILFGFR